MMNKMSLAEFMIFEAAQAERHEFWDGKILAMAATTARHNRVVLNLNSRVAEHLDGTQCQVFSQMMKVQVDNIGLLYPDVMVTCEKQEAGDEVVVTDRKLVIEVLSPSTDGYAKRDKFARYRRLASLREYVLIDPTKRRVEALTLNGSGTWLTTDQTELSELSMISIDCRVPMRSIFRGVESDCA